MKTQKILSLIVSAAMLTSALPVNTATALTVDQAEKGTRISRAADEEAPQYAVTTTTTIITGYHTSTTTTTTATTTKLI